MDLKLVEPTPPNRTPLVVNGAAVADADKPVSTYPAPSNAVLVFGVGPKALRLAVRETMAELRSMWAAQGLPGDAFD